MRRLFGWLLSTALHGGVLALACVITVKATERHRPQPEESFAVELRRPDAPAVIPPQRDAREVPPADVGEVPAELTNDQPQIAFDVFDASPVEKPVKEYTAAIRPFLPPSRRGGRMSGGQGMGVSGPGGDTPIGNVPGRPGPGDGSGTGEQPAVEVYNPSPEYPTSARRRGAEGNVLVEISVGADGMTADAKVVESSGAEDLDAAAITAVKNWKFRAAVRDGKPAVSTERIRFVFKLKA